MSGVDTVKQHQRQTSWPLKILRSITRPMKMHQSSFAVQGDVSGVTNHTSTILGVSQALTAKVVTKRVKTKLRTQITVVRIKHLSPPFAMLILAWPLK